MAGKKKQLGAEQELSELVAATVDLSAAEARERLRVALKSGKSLVVARAAKLIQERLIDGLERELEAAFERFLLDAVKSDPSCRAKLAVLEALDALESTQAEPFLTAVRHVQLEPAWGPPVDAAVGLRSCAALGLARIGHPDVPLLMGELLADKAWPVRQAAADALAAFGERAAAGALLHKLRVGDEEPLVTLACMGALLTLAPDWGLATLGPLLEERDEEMRELAAVALGQSRREDALERLLAALAKCVISRERGVFFRAIALHRSERALASLLDIISDGAPADARAVVAALASRRFEPGLEQRVRNAATRNERADLGAAITEVFTDE